MTSLTPHSEAAERAILDMRSHLMATAGESPVHLRHARCIEQVLAATTRALAAERDNGADDFEIFLALTNALGNAVTSICSTLAGGTEREDAVGLFNAMMRQITLRAATVLGPGGTPGTEFVSVEAKVGRA
jgi:hypothetical protein